VCRTAEVVCGKWTLLLIRDLAEGRSRFCELERSLEGISPRTLSLRLRALEEEGVVERHTFPEVPPRVEYALTEKGLALLPIVQDMRAYGERWLSVERPRQEGPVVTEAVAAGPAIAEQVGTEQVVAEQVVAELVAAGA
jgi:DNA-binding HxlR family transcriptional regulator